MKNKKCKITSFGLSLLMLVTSFSTPVFALTETEEVSSADKSFEALEYSMANIDKDVKKTDLAPDYTSLGGIFKSGNNICYKNIDFETGQYNTLLMSISALGGQKGKKIELRLDSPEGTKIGAITLEESEKNTEFKDHYTNINSVIGIHDLYFVFKDDMEINIDFFTFSTFDGSKETKEEKDARMQWWRDAKYGQFIHWGAYSQLGGVYEGKSVAYSEWIMNNLNISQEDYERDAAKKFSPTQFDAKKIVQLAKDAGQKYIVFTSRHHEGLSMYDTKVREFKDYSLFSFCNNGEYQGLDPIEELSRECEEAGIKFGVYYTILDWHDKSQNGANRNTVMKEGEKEEFKTRMKAQLRELVETYHSKIFFFDGEWPSWWTKEDGQEFYRYLRTLDPELIINNRVGKRNQDDGDYGTPEQEIPSTGLDYDWESCITLNNSWGYHKNDNNWKNADIVIDNLVSCTSKGGNYLLNIGPDEQGVTPKQSEIILKEAGTWIEKYGDSIYGTKASCFSKLPNGILATTKENKVYLHITKSYDSTILKIPNLKNEIRGIKIMGSNQNISYDIVNNNILIDMTDVKEVKYDTVLEMDVVGKPEEIENIDINYAAKADKVTATNSYNSKYEANQAIDNDNNTRWASKDGTTSAQLVLEYNNPITVNTAHIINYNHLNTNNWINEYSVDYWNGNNWVTLKKNGKMDSEENITFDSVTSNKFRLNMIEASNPSIYEFQLFNREIYEVKITSPEIIPAITSRPEGIPILSTPFEVAGTSIGGTNIEVQLKSIDFTSKPYITKVNADDGSWKVDIDDIVTNGKCDIKVILKDENDIALAIDTISVYLRETQNLAKGKKTTVSSCYQSPEYDGSSATDSYMGTRWAPLDSDLTPSMTIDFEKETTFNQFVITELFDTWGTPNDYRCRKFEIEAFEDEEWKVIYEGTRIGEELTINLEKEITASKLRLKILENRVNDKGKSEPTNIIEFEVYHTKDMKLADYSAVELAIERANALNPDDYKDFSKVIDAIEAVEWDLKENEQFRVNEMAKAIEDAIAALEPVTTNTDKTALKIALEKANSINDEDLANVVPAVVEEFKAALQEANDVYADASANQEQVNNAFDRLANAMQKLEFFKGDKKALEAFVNKVAGLNKDSYTKATWAAFEAALNNADEVLEDVNALEKEVNEAYDALVRAFLDLRLIPNKDLLNDLINKAEGLEAANYSADSFKAMQEALANAKAVAANENATQAEVDNAKDVLAKALDNLQGVNNTVNTPTTDNKVTSVNNGDTTSVKTGDNNLISLFAGLSLLSVAGYSVLRKKNN